MSKRAEQAALKAYPTHKGASPQWVQAHLKGICSDYIKGYEQAEKDLALTPQDIGIIFNLVRECQKGYSSTEGCYEEVLAKFNKIKK